MEPEVTYAELWLPGQVKRGPKAVVQTTASTSGKTPAASSSFSKYFKIVGLLSVFLLVTAVVLLVQVLLLSSQVQDKTMEVKQCSANSSHLSDSLQQILNKSAALQESFSQLSSEHRHLAAEYQQLNETLPAVLEERKRLLECYEYSRHVLTNRQLFDCRMENVSSGRDVSCRACPLGWTSENRHCYYFSDEKKTWQQGQNFCEVNQSHLMTVNSREEQVLAILSTR
ncbi:C-type lectin domain family 10 member A-like isoform X2 [Rhinatrema bivittatum]|uniref:C-type lectin domain family 10 member A-like isoform X2 n=1 Tax=Rhinatrema bivittatum TaxID=194408 RepID=UPI001128DB21|nr:C-type lectin domain family 10 member A-like isoform X2 [Rhinatrema bivittatum]